MKDTMDNKVKAHLKNLKNAAFKQHRRDVRNHRDEYLVSVDYSIPA